MSIGTLASYVTVLGFLAGIIAVVFAAKQLRTQALSQGLTAVLETNRLWTHVRDRIGEPVTLSLRTLTLLPVIYQSCVSDRESSVLRADELTHPVQLGIPFLLAALFPGSEETPLEAPGTESAYRQRLLDRALSLYIAVRVLRAVAAGRDEAWMTGGTRITATERGVVSEDLARIDSAMEVYVNSLNEVAELYEVALIDQELFLGKRHVALIQQAFVAEPYILLRNVATPSRWGMRVLSLGESARAFQWQSSLHVSGIRLRRDPDGLGPTVDGYPGLSLSVGWIVGADAPEPRRTRRASGGHGFRAHFSRGFTRDAKRTQNVMVDLLKSILEPPLSDAPNWMSLAAEPLALKRARSTLKDGLASESRRGW